MSEPSLERQAIRSPGASSVISETRSSSAPAGPAMVHAFSKAGRSRKGLSKEDHLPNVIPRPDTEMSVAADEVDAPETNPSDGPA